MIFLSLKNSSISFNHQNYCHQNWWHFCHSKTHLFLQITKILTTICEISIENSIHQNWWKFLQKFSTKLSPILVVPLNLSQFWWLFIKKMSDLLKFSPKLVKKKQTKKLTNFIKSTKKPNLKELLSLEFVKFSSLKNLPISSIHQKFQQNRWKIWQNSIEHYKSSKFSLKICENFGKNSFENECGFFKVIPPLSGSWK